MERMTGRCGLVCTECPAMVATQAGDQEALARTAAQWTKALGLEFTLDNIRCEGCIPEGGTRSAYCARCEIRPCAEARGVATCAECEDYVCDVLADFLRHAPDAEENLEWLRSED
jgi:hypothetical protein